MTMKNTHILACACALMLLIGGHSTAQAQNGARFTLTNGHEWWYTGSDSDDPHTSLIPKDTMTYRYNSATKKYEEDYPMGSITLIAQQGDRYLKLDTGNVQTHTPPSIVAADTTGGFDPLCVWSRTDYTGFYYQEWGQYRYYLVGSRSRGLEVSRIRLGDPTDDVTLWHDWDYGASVQEDIYRNGKNTSSYYWILYDNVTDDTPVGCDASAPCWRLSVDSYQRPDAKKFHRSDDDLLWSYYDSTLVDGHKVRSGQAAVYLPVTMEYHAAKIKAFAGNGFEAVALTKEAVAFDAEHDKLLPSDELTLSPAIDAVTSGGDPVRHTVVATVTPGYTEYGEESYRYGINTNWRNRNEEEFGSAGIATIEHYYYHDVDPHVRETAAPDDINNAELVIIDTTYTLDPRSRRYASIEKSNDGTHATLTYFSQVPTHNHHATLTVTVRFAYTTPGGETVYIDRTKTTTLTLDFEEHHVDRTPTNAPVVYGYVCGGGRMAKVTGNTNVTVHNTDSIYALYGGNDIAGWVQGDDGATIQIGTQYTTSPLRIAYVYGGGCGFYSYENTFDAVYYATHKPDMPDDLSTTQDSLDWMNGDGASGIATAFNAAWAGEGQITHQIGYGNYAFRGSVYEWGNTTPGGLVATGFDYNPYLGYRDFNLAEDGNSGNGVLPYVKTSHITVGIDADNAADAAAARAKNNQIHIDTLFGGGENSFIGVTDRQSESTAITMDIYGGTIFSVFGGNNYGGSVANTAKVIIDVYDTKTTTEHATLNSWLKGYGRDFGIRYLFGGGNLVDGSHAWINLYGGMIDTCFGGGNAATVKSPRVVVNCLGDHYIFENDSITKEWVDAGGNLIEGPEPWTATGARLSAHRPMSNPTYYNALVNHSPGRFNQNIGRYNVRCLFGGNNKADMDSLTYIELRSGGIQSLYGGGNAGDMNYSGPIPTGIRVARDFAFDRIDALGNPIAAENRGWEFDVPQRISSFIHSDNTSKILVESIYGGCRMANVKTSTAVDLHGGTFGYVQGGNDISGDVGTEGVDGDEGTSGTWVVVAENTLVLQDVYGGSDGYYHCQRDGRYYSTDDAITDYNDEPYDPYDEYIGKLAPTHNRTNLYIKGGRVLFSAYGGGVMTNVGYQKETGNMKPTSDGGESQMDLTHIGGMKKGSVHFVINNGIIGSHLHHGDGYGDGNAYGGGYLSKIYGLGYFFIKGNTHIHGSVYAGNDVTGIIDGYGAYTMPGKGPDELVASDGTTNLNSYDEESGTWYTPYTSYLRIDGTPKISCVYGSGNGAYDYDGTRPYYSDMEPVCVTAELNRPQQKSTFIDLHTEGFHLENDIEQDGWGIDTVFGGGNGVGVLENATVLLNSANNNGRYIGTIFGGNNRDKMTCVPQIILTKGVVKNVFGGGNAGDMAGKKTLEAFDYCGNDVPDVSTYIQLTSDQVTIEDSIFGGCRMANLVNMAYIDIRNTTAPDPGDPTKPYGINYIFGGNDVSGNVDGNTRIDMCGGYVHHIYGGSNGRYDYQQTGYNDYTIFKFGSAHGASDTIAKHTLGMPVVDSTTINVFGGTITKNLYGGGAMGDCRATYINIDDHQCYAPGGVEYPNAELLGSVFGGGEGDTANLNHTRRGNVTEATHVHLRHASTLSGAKAYGGGMGGDVHSTYITAYETWEIPFEELYGGCWGSDVYGTTHVEMHGKDLGESKNVKKLFGGNDFTGNVYKSVVNIYSGKYNYIYGAGNGEYSANLYRRSPNYNTAATQLYVPNNEYTELNFHGGTVEYNVYGGGQYGTTIAYRKNALGEYVLDANGRKIADTARAAAADAVTTVAAIAAAQPAAESYAYQIINVHDGTLVKQNIYAGAAGDMEEKKQLVYGLKMINMDGGTVMQSIYGGSENVSDGYPRECYDSVAAKTTMRPSSVLNITGGTIQSHVYGGGYLGGIYGSAYINLGLTAIDSCPVWTKTYAGVANAYALFKPGNASEEAHCPTLEITNDLMLNASIYGGANWGENTGGADFTARGFFGGESRIIVDGQGYNTSLLNRPGQALFNIAKSIYGSGTSAQSGDMLNRVEVRNYGELGEDCHATKTLNTIQRTHQLWLHNTAIEYIGATDATSVYTTQEYSLMNVDTINARGFNLVEMDATVSSIRRLYFYQDALDANGSLQLVTQSLINSNTYTNGACREDPSDCQMLQVLHPTSSTTTPYTAMAFNSGTSFNLRYDSITPSLATEEVYGAVFGYGYFIAAAGSDAIIIGRWKIPDTDPAHNYLDGGFSAFCCDSNMAYSASGSSVSWTADNSTCIDKEFKYTDYQSTYRVWSSGKGTRRIWTTLHAHSDPKLLPDEDRLVLHRETSPTTVDHKICVAKAELILPPSAPGHYYKLIDNSFVLTGDVTDVALVDSAWLPTNWAALPTANWHASPDNTDYGDIHTISAPASSKDGLKAIHAAPENTFGLMMIPGANFSTTDYVTGYGPAKAQTVITGNSHVNYSQDYCSPKIDGNATENVAPRMVFYLTYDNSFSNTFLGNVTFKFAEYDASGHDIGSEIEVKVIISTIINEFTDMETDVLAMYNEGRTNHFRRKVVLPATLQHRDLYVTSVRWYPTDKDGNNLEGTATTPADLFYLAKDEATVTTGAGASAHNRFGITISPSDNLTSAAESAIGWHQIDSANLNVWQLVKSRYTSLADVSEYSHYNSSLGTNNCLVDGEGDPAPASEVSCGSAWNDTVTLRDLNSCMGLKVGELDGRGLAVFNVDLTYNGNQTYEDILGKGYVGKVVLSLESRVAGNIVGHPFHLTINIRTRLAGDTIYLASAPSISRGDYELFSFGTSGAETDPNLEGKRPNAYVRDFTTALSRRIYQEGDVIAILDSVKISGTDKYTITGIEYNTLPVIRYCGHHWQMPGEVGVYRGPMIIVDGPEAYLNARCIAFDGSVTGKVTPILDNEGHLGTKVNDTNRVYGPIFLARNGGTVTLSNGSMVLHNWNEYTGAREDLKGTINLTKGGTLMLQYDVVIEDNFNHNFAAGHPANGAVYINNGKMRLPITNSNTAIDITHNFLMPTVSDAGARTEPDWCTDNSVRWMIDTHYVYTTYSASFPKANVFLTRDVCEPDDNLCDSQSDYITLEAQAAEKTQIGVSKWFPGETVRDTILIVTKNTGGNVNNLQTAVTKGNFLSDEGYDVVYSRSIDMNYIYLLRCATFKHQSVSVNLPFAHVANKKGVQVLQYDEIAEATCPTGGDKISYHVQGGFFPYTYTWTGSQEQSRTTPYTNLEMMAQIDHGNSTTEADYVHYYDALGDTLTLEHISMTPYQSRDTLNFTVTADDVTKKCQLKKNIKIILAKETRMRGIFDPFTTTLLEGDPAEEVDYSSYWTSTNNANLPLYRTDTAKAVRNYPAVKVTPVVWAEQLGTISTLVNSTPTTSDSVFTTDAYGHHPLEQMTFCAGDQLTLSTKARVDGEGNPQGKFIMWDFDPYYRNPVSYTVPAQNTTIIAYYGPLDYWVDVVDDPVKAKAGYDSTYYYANRTWGEVAHSYVTTLNGDVHIYDEDGLAWFISVVNGLNGTQARPFYFNNVYLHDKSGGYDMKAHLWTPVGTIQHRFRGRFIGVGNTSDSCTALAASPVVIKNIIVDEPDLQYAGFFAMLDSATVKNITLQGAFIRGSQYVGTLAARSVDSKIDHVTIERQDDPDADIAATILTTHHTSGGMIGYSDHDAITNSTVGAKYVGDAVYSGGVVGYGVNNVSILNNQGYGKNHMEGLYIGGVAGWFEGTAPYSNSGAKSQNYGRMQNNYVHLVTDGRSQRVGGLVGYATNSLIENNYVHGTILGSATEGGVAAVLDDGSWSDHNYYEQTAVDKTVGQQRGTAVMSENTDFSGQGNQVQLGTATYGVNNLTRVLNLWVRQHGDEYKTWRSDLENENYGYPLFGEPDLIPVHDEFTYEGCDSLEWEGLLYNETTVLNSHVIDSLLMIDSTATLTLLVHHSTSEQHADTTLLGQDYSGYGFEISAAELDLLRLSVNIFGSATIVLSDTLTTATGCDSIVNLSLTVTKATGIVNVEPTGIKVYPNPTTSRVTIETEGLSRVELYDTEGRRLQDYTTRNDHEITIDVSNFATGAYYLRIHRGNDVTIQKLIKK